MKYLLTIAIIAFAGAAHAESSLSGNPQTGQAAGFGSIHNVAGIYNEFDPFAPGFGPNSTCCFGNQSEQQDYLTGTTTGGMITKLQKNNTSGGGGSLGPAKSGPARQTGCGGACGSVQARQNAAKRQWAAEHGNGAGS